MAEGVRSVFLSYASQDAEAAGTLAEALRAAGITVWLDQNELRGGDAWDQRIRQQIRDCTLFIPIISQNTQARVEGYFRLEWRLADQRTHLMGRSRTFLVPVSIDATRESDADVPESFFAYQWSRLTGGHTTPEFITRISALLSPAPGANPPAPGASTRDVPVVGRQAAPRGWSWKVPSLLIAGLAIIVIGCWVTGRYMRHKVQATPDFNPPAHSVAVLPFINMSGDKEQDYFSDGLTEELLNALARVSTLQVAARTSAFSFKGKDAKIGTIARELNVGSILEGSVRRSGRTVRITAQLINTVTGFNLWSQSYDRDLDDVLKLQSDIANAVAGALKVALLEGASPRLEMGGTRNSKAFDSYLRAIGIIRKAPSTNTMDCQAPMEAFGHAIELDPEFALAYAQRASFIWTCATNSPEWLNVRQPDAGMARTDAQRAIALAPELAEGYLALSNLEEGLLHFVPADQACARALALAPGSAQVLGRCSLQAAYFGRADDAIAGTRHAVDLDPLDPRSHRALGDTLRYARRYEAAIAAYQDAIAIDPEHAIDTKGIRGMTYFSAGNLALARTSCEEYPDDYRSRVCLSMVYHKLGMLEQAAAVYAQLVREAGDASSYQYTQIHAQREDPGVACGWFEKAAKLGDPGLIYAKVDPLLDPLRQQPCFIKVLQSLHFPD